MAVLEKFYGPRHALDNPYQGVLGIFLGNLLRGEPITIYGDGEQSRDFAYISDVVDAWAAALTNTAAYGEVFNLGSGQQLEDVRDARPELRVSLQRSERFLKLSALLSVFLAAALVAFLARPWSPKDFLRAAMRSITFEPFGWASSGSSMIFSPLAFCFFSMRR